ncbi:MAG TPA: hypothetical protein VI564_07285 [Candidatus Nanoarchaeia archaeon]|nr:hypothetical protein [Candidatus Nanoarchaeia archaeon]
MNYKIIQEGKARLKIPLAEKVSKDMGVFYNPVMQQNRDISVLLLNSMENKSMQIADPLAASGIRSIRFLKELKKGKIKNITVNDYSKDAIKLIKSNLELNKIKWKESKKIQIINEEANLFLLNSMGFDYIDIDPFGTPNPFLDSACKRISREGILAVTATDTAPLCGTYKDACIRKYWAVPSNNYLMHEIGLRILIRKVQLIGAQYDKALVPIFSYSKEHYMRIFFSNTKGKTSVDEILKQHDYFKDAGPLWAGQLWDSKLAVKIYNNAAKDIIFSKNKGLMDLLRVIKDESKIACVGFHDINELCSKYKLKNPPKKQFIIEKAKKLRYPASGTHFKGSAVRSNISEKKLVKILKLRN